MKIALYIRRDPKHADCAYMFTSLEPEPCYDTPRVANVSRGIHEALVSIIARCEEDGIITTNGKVVAKMSKKLKKEKNI